MVDAIIPVLLLFTLVAPDTSLKFRAYLVVLLLLVTIAAIGVYLYRDSIARDVANSVLKDSDLAVTGVSIDSIGTNDIVFNELVLEQRDRTRIRIAGITLPINTRSTRSSVLSVDSVEIISSSKSDQPAAIGAILAAILELPQNIPFSTVRISRVITDGLPPFTNVSWESSEDGQLLRLDIGSFAVIVGVDPGSDVGHRVFITATTPDDIVAVALALVVDREDGRFVVSGQSTTRVAPLLPGSTPANMSPRSRRAPY